MKIKILTNWSIPHRLTVPTTLTAIFLATLSFDKSYAIEDKAYQELLTTISSPLPEYGLVVSPDDSTAIFTRMSMPWGSRGNKSKLFITRKLASGWSSPEPLFDGNFETSDAFFSSDGQRLYFATNQTLDGPPKIDDDIWYGRMNDGEVGNVKPLTIVNSDAVESSPVVTTSGNLYFSSRRKNGIGAGDIWISRFSEGAYQKPENLNAPINTPNGEWNVYVSPDEQYLIVESSGRKGAKSDSGDLYFHTKKDGIWSAAIALSKINTTGSDLMPRLSPDGKGFFYTSSGALGASDTEIYYHKINDLYPAPPNPDDKSLMVVSRSNHEIIALNPITLDVIARYPTGKGPHEIVASPNGKTLFTPAYGVFPRPHEKPIKPSEMQFTSAPADTLTRISLHSGKTELPSNSISTAFTICERSHGVAVTSDTHLWVTCQEESRVMEMDSNTGDLINNWPIGVKGSHILVSTADNSYVVTSNVSAGSISIINRLTGHINTVPTGNGAEGLAITPDQQHVWVGNTQNNNISVVRITDGRIVNQFTSHGRFPVKMTIVKDTEEVWVVNTFSNDVAILDLNDGKLKQKLSFASPPLGIISSNDGKTVYVTFPRLNEVRAFNRETRQEIARTDKVMEGDGMAWASAHD